MPQFFKKGSRSDFPYRQVQLETERKFHKFNFTAQDLKAIQNKDPLYGTYLENEWFHGQHWYPWAKVDFVMQNVKMEFRFQPKWNATWMLDYMKPRLPMLASDVIVFNVGVHYANNLVLFKNHVMEFIYWFGTYFPGTAILRQFSPSHHNYTSNGEYARPDLDDGDTGVSGCVPCKWHLDKFRDTVSSLLYRCRAGDSLDEGGQIVVKNRCTNIHILPIADSVHDPYDAHFGSFGTKPGTDPRVKDCTHWCMPGPPDAWATMLFNYAVNDPAPVSEGGSKGVWLAEQDRRSEQDDTEQGSLEGE